MLSHPAFSSCLACAHVTTPAKKRYISANLEASMLPTIVIKIIINT